MVLGTTLFASLHEGTTKETLRILERALAVQAIDAVFELGL